MAVTGVREARNCSTAGNSTGGCALENLTMQSPPSSQWTCFKRGCQPHSLCTGQNRCPWRPVFKLKKQTSWNPRRVRGQAEAPWGGPSGEGAREQEEWALGRTRLHSLTHRRPGSTYYVPATLLVLGIEKWPHRASKQQQSHQWLSHFENNPQ